MIANLPDEIEDAQRVIDTSVSKIAEGEEEAGRILAEAREHLRHGFVAARIAFKYLTTPDEMRGRVSAANALFIGASNQLGDFESGVVAALVTPLTPAAATDDVPGGAPAAAHGMKRHASASRDQYSGL